MQCSAATWRLLAAPRRHRRRLFAGCRRRRFAMGPAQCSNNGLLSSLTLLSNGAQLRYQRRLRMALQWAGRTPQGWFLRVSDRLVRM